MEEQVDVRDLLADERCGQAVLDFLSTTDVGRLVPPLEEEGVAGSEVSEWELRERRERRERVAEAAELGAAGDLGDGGGGATAVSTHAPLHGIRRRGVEPRGDGFLCSSLCFSFVISLVRLTSSWDRPGRRAKGSLQHAATARTADRKNRINVRRHDLDRSKCEYD